MTNIYCISIPRKKQEQPRSPPLVFTSCCVLLGDRKYRRVVLKAGKDGFFKSKTKTPHTKEAHFYVILVLLITAKTMNDLCSRKRGTQGFVFLSARFLPCSPILEAR